MNQSDMKASDVLAKDPIAEKKKDLELAKKVEQEKTVPSGYIEVKLSSLGKLGLPPVVHVRDYTYEEALQMVEMQEEKITEGMIGILNNVVFEDIDMGKAHIEDATEILLSIYGTWYAPTLEVFKYYVNEDLEGEEKEAKENISVATIPINNIKTIPLDKKISTPITLKKEGFEVQLIPPRIENDMIAWRFAVQKYLGRENEIADIIKKVKKEIASSEELEIYEEFTHARGKDFMRALQSLLIYSFNGRVLEGFAEKLEVLQEIPLSVWKTYNKIMKEHFNFGVQKEVSFCCSVTQKEITRSFRFRPHHFLPVLDQEDNSGLEVSFG